MLELHAFNRPLFEERLRARKLIMKGLARATDRPPSVISMIRYGFLPPEETRRQIADLLGVTVDELWIRLGYQHDGWQVIRADETRP